MFSIYNENKIDKYEYLTKKVFLKIIGNRERKSRDVERGYIYINV